MCNPLEFGWSTDPRQPNQFYLSNIFLRPSQREPGQWRLDWLGQVWRVPDYQVPKETWRLQRQLEMEQMGMVLDDEI